LKKLTGVAILYMYMQDKRSIIQGD